MTEDILYKDNAFFVVEAAGGVVCAPDGRILMMMRRGMWDLPKGHREQGETSRECAAREVVEECGLDPAALAVDAELVRTVHTYYYKPLGRWEEKHTVWFRMTYSGDVRDVAPQAEEDITALEWMTLQDAVRAAATSYKTIREVIDKITNYDIDYEKCSYVNTDNNGDFCFVRGEKGSPEATRNQ